MKKLLTLILLLLMYTGVFSQDCVLPNGKYKVEYDEGFEKYPKFYFKIKNNKFIYIDLDENVEYTIEKNEDCYLVLEKKEVDETNFTELQKLLNKQHPFYTFEKINDKVYEFIYRDDLHVTISEGKFIKQ
ncbi:MULTISPECIES: hypothetical protein [Mesonia]|uniref:Uncharacterized protein n=1 Tax=Mesonia oceanica TaxID=2687242 RepID=A0AC61YC44_9FLAO|nr:MULTISPECIES: hypothetical protein [Mesonia]VVV02072.1 hypothetical protein FVB9532_03368 [Mesonia oceanica]|tara:strand:+ start:84560 stop:84949 length:390 start_codon:yes stop_codon:yes gene_type:complete